MDFLWGPPQDHPQVVAQPLEVQQKAEQAFSSPTSLASRLGSRNVITPSTGSTTSTRSLHSSKHYRRFSKPADPVMDAIVDSTKVVPSTKTATIVDSSACSQVELDLACESKQGNINATRSQSLSQTLIKKHNGTLDRRHSNKEIQIEESGLDLSGSALIALSNADSVIAKATDSFRKTFNFISASHEVSNDITPVSPSTASTWSETPPLSPALPAERSGKYPNQQYASCDLNDSDDFDPILEARSVLSSPPTPELRSSLSADSSSSLRLAHLSLATRGADKWKCRSQQFSNSPDTHGPDTYDATPDEYAAASQELALLKLKASMSHLGSAFTTVAFGTTAKSGRDIPSLLNNRSDDSFDPTFLPNQATNSTGAIANHVAQASANPTVAVKELRLVKLHDSLSVLPSHAIDSAWMSYCDLPSLLQSQSSTLSFDGEPETKSRPVSPPVITENSCRALSQQDAADDFVLLARGQSINFDNEPLETIYSEEVGMTRSKALPQMQASLGSKMLTVSGYNSSDICTALDAAKGRTKPVCASPQLEGRKRRALEPEEQNDLFAGDRKRIGLEPEEEHTDFGVDELLMKVENEEITCLTEETYEVVSTTKYYSVEVASSGLSIPQCEQAAASEYVTFSNETVERHIQASFYLEDLLVDVPLVDTLQELRDSPSEREHRERWGASSYHSSCGSETEETDPYSPSIAAADGISEHPTVIVKGEDPPGEGPWHGICTDPCLSDGTDLSLTSPNVIFCHQSPKDLSDSLSASLLEIGSKVQQLDDEHAVSKQVSKSVAELGSTLTSFWKQADEAFGVSAATKQVSTALKETAKNPPKPEDIQRRLREIDEEHRIIEQTASAVADGAQYLAQRIESLAVSSTSRPGILMTGTA